MTKTISRTELRSGPIGHYGLEEVELPNGHRLVLDVLRHPGAAAAVVFVSPSRVLLLRQYRHAGGGWLWEIPAGKLDDGEEPLDCIAREIEEETGYCAAHIEWLGEILPAAAYTDERIRLYLAADLSAGTVQHGPGENIEVHEVEFDEALAMIDRGDIVDAKTIAALYHCAVRRRRGVATPSSSCAR